MTICIKSRECLFGDIVDEEMRLSDAGCMIDRRWNDLPTKYAGIEIDEFIVMPNHVHGIIVIVGAPLVGAHSSGMQACRSIMPEPGQAQDLPLHWVMLSVHSNP